MEPFDEIDRQLVAELTANMRAHGVAALELQVDQQIFRLRIGAADDAQADTASGGTTSNAVAPGVGRFLRSHPARANPQKDEGSEILMDEVIGFIRSGNLLRPVVSPAPGRLLRFDSSENDVVSFGTPVAHIVSGR